MEHTSPRHARARPPPEVSAERRDTCCQAAKADPRVASAKTQPAPRRTRGSPSRMPGNRTPRTAESAHVPIAITATSFSCAEHPVGRLPPELGVQELLGPAPFGVDLGAFHLEADAVAVEGFLEGGDDHAGEPGFERPSGGQVRRGETLAGALLAPARHVDERPRRCRRRLPIVAMPIGSA